MTHWVLNYSLKNTAINHGKVNNSLCGFTTWRTCFGENRVAWGTASLGLPTLTPARHTTASL